MAQPTITFRPRREVEMDMAIVVEFCNTHNITFNALINSYLPAIAYALVNKVFIDEQTGGIHVLSDFGHVEITKGKEQQIRTEYLT